jgi:hypothetical protein
MYNAKKKDFNNMEYMRYVDLTKGQIYSYAISPSSLYSGCYMETMTAAILVVSLKGFDAKTN